MLDLKSRPWTATESQYGQAPTAIEFGRPLRPRIPAWVSVAPMMDKTDRHFRWFLRQLTKRALLYTEMITAEAIIHGDRERLLAIDPMEHPVALQLGGDNPDQLYEAIRIATDYGYDEFNLNVGCPSDRVQHRNFGACLMASPDLVADCLTAMGAATTKPVTIKHRVGIRGFGHSVESFDELAYFVGRIAQAGCDGFAVHARIAILEGLSPKENRSVPPLRYEDVWRLKADYPNLPVEINGQIKTWDEAALHLERVDAVMIGRPSYENSWLFASCDAFCDAMDRRAGRPTAPVFAPEGRATVVLDYAAYLDAVCRERDANPRSLIWPLLELFSGLRGSRKYKQVLSQPIARGTSLVGLTQQALQFIEKESL